MFRHDAARGRYLAGGRLHYGIVGGFDRTPHFSFSYSFYAAPAPVDATGVPSTAGRPIMYFAHLPKPTRREVMPSCLRARPYVLGAMPAHRALASTTAAACSPFVSSIHTQATAMSIFLGLGAVALRGDLDRILSSANIRPAEIDLVLVRARRQTRSETALGTAVCGLHVEPVSLRRDRRADQYCTQNSPLRCSGHAEGPKSSGKISATWRRARFSFSCSLSKAIAPGVGANSFGIRS